MRGLLHCLAHPVTPLVLAALHSREAYDLADALTQEWPATNTLVGEVGAFFIGRDVPELPLPDPGEELGDPASLAGDRRLEGSGLEMVVAVGMACFFIGIGASIWLIVAWVYKTSITDMRPPFPATVPEAYSMAGKDFRHRLAECCDDSEYCLYGCFCCEVRMADTYHTAGVGWYWAYVAVYLVFWITFQLLATFGFAMFPFLGVFVWYIAWVPFGMWFAKQRGKLRQVFGGDSSTKFFDDFMCYWCCGCCVAIQEARQVDEATNTRVQCLFKLSHALFTAPGLPGPSHVGAVGPPVGIVRPAGMVQQGLPGAQIASIAPPWAAQPMQAQPIQGQLMQAQPIQGQLMQAQHMQVQPVQAYHNQVMPGQVKREEY